MCCYHLVHFSCRTVCTLILDEGTFFLFKVFHLNLGESCQKSDCFVSYPFCLSSFIPCYDVCRNAGDGVSCTFLSNNNFVSHPVTCQVGCPMEGKCVMSFLLPSLRVLTIFNGNGLVGDFLHIFMEVFFEAPSLLP